MQSGGRYFIYYQHKIQQAKLPMPKRPPPPNKRTRQPTTTRNDAEDGQQQRRVVTYDPSTVHRYLDMYVASWCTLPPTHSGCVERCTLHGPPNMGKTAQQQKRQVSGVLSKKGVLSRDPGNSKGSHLSQTQHVLGTKYSRTSHLGLQSL